MCTWCCANKSSILEKISVFAAVVANFNETGRYDNTHISSLRVRPKFVVPLLIELIEQKPLHDCTHTLQYVMCFCFVGKLSDSLRLIGNESVPIQLAQFRFPGLAIFSAKILIYFSNKIYGNNFIKQHSETVMVWNYQNADCSLRKKIIVSFFFIIFGTLSFPNTFYVTFCRLL